MTSVKIQNIQKTYGIFNAVRNVNINIDQGEFLTLLGPSGCGKTTTLRMVAGFIEPSAGQIYFGDKEITKLPPHKREIGLVFQSYALFPHMTVAENIAFGLKMRKCSKAEIAERVREAVALVKLEKMADRLPKALSGGQQQRVALARALVIRPKLLLLDEPFGALDRQLRDHMRIELRNLQQALNLPTVFVTHDQGEALSMSDRVVVMSEGQVEQIGAPAELYDHPQSKFVAAFLGKSNILTLKVEQGVARAGTIAVGVDGSLPAGTMSAIIRPERIGIAHSSADVGAANVGVVRSISYLGAATEVIVDMGGVEIEVLIPNTGESTPHFKFGEKALLSIPAEAIATLSS